MLLSMLLFLFPLSDGIDTSVPPLTVDKVDLSRYTGLWYEYAKIANPFQRKCVRGVTAHYTLRDDGKIIVVNRCIDKDGKVKQATGIARIVDNQSNSKLQVSFVRLFGLSLFWGDYWVIGLGDDYEYAVVGVPDRKYGWILSRTPSLDQERLGIIYNILHENGYDPGDFIPTDQTNELVQ